VVLTGSTAENNQGFGVFDYGADNSQITGNLISENYLFGVDIAGNTNAVAIDSNTITWNTAGWFYAHGESPLTEGVSPRDISIENTATNITQSGNTVSPER
jgi:hypothetical protein